MKFARSVPPKCEAPCRSRPGEYIPDFYAFETESFIILPWDREIIQDGEIIVRPDYAARL